MRLSRPWPPSGFGCTAVAREQLHQADPGQPGRDITEEATAGETNVVRPATFA
ncbi:MAG: hypothetical protein ACK5Q5_23605 [Planctomycetaceae bacterium]